MHSQGLSSLHRPEPVAREAKGSLKLINFKVQEKSRIGLLCMCCWGKEEILCVLAAAPLL